MYFMLAGQYILSDQYKILVQVDNIMYNIHRLQMEGSIEWLKKLKKDVNKY